VENLTAMEHAHLDNLIATTSNTVQRLRAVSDRLEKVLDHIAPLNSVNPMSVFAEATSDEGSLARLSCTNARFTGCVVDLRAQMERLEKLIGPKGSGAA